MENGLLVTMMKEIIEQQYKILKRCLSRIDPYECGRLVNDITLSIRDTDNFVKIWKSANQESRPTPRAADGGKPSQSYGEWLSGDGS